MCLWSEPVGETTTIPLREDQRKKFSQNWLQEPVYSNTQRFVVVRPRYEQHFSMCLPIKTYGGKGAAKFWRDPGSHGIIFTGQDPPDTLPREPELTKMPIRVHTVDPTEQLDEESRINFAKPTPVEHNLKVKNIGRVNRDHIHRLERYFEQEILGPPSAAGAAVLFYIVRGST